MSVHTFTVRALFLVGLVCGSAHAQILHGTGDRPSFEVATIRLWNPPPSPPSDGTSAPRPVVKVSPIAGGGQSTDRVHLILPIALLIASAYNLPVGSESRRIRGPGWLRQETDQYEIQAKIEDSLFAAMQKMTPAQQREQVALMEQSLLADRFSLKVHFETEDMPVYALVVAKGGPRLTPAEEGESTRLSMAGKLPGREMTGIAVTLDQFALSPLLTGSADGRVVVNQTGLKGAYDFTLKWAQEQPAAPDAAEKPGADAPAFFTAIQEQLGLKLVASKAPLEVIVVDRIERPSAN